MRRALIAILASILLLVSLTLPISNSIVLHAYAQKLPKMEYTVYAPEYDPVRVRAAQMFAEYAKKVGVLIHVRPVDFNVEMTKVFDDRDFDMYIIGWSSSNMPMYFSRFLVSWQDVPGGTNPEGFHNKTFDELARELDATVDRDKQREIIFKMQEILASEVPRLGIYTRYITQIWQKGWEGFHLEYWGYASPFTWRYVHHPTKDTFIVVLNDDIRIPNPLRAGSIYEDYVWDCIYDALVQLDDNYNPVPWLAYKWEISKDGKTWTFYIVQNATWHDGKPVTGEDIAFTLEYVWKNKVPNYIRLWRYFKKIELVDKYTVRIVLNQSYAWLLYDLAGLYILPKHIWVNLKWNASSPPLIGCGPFKWTKRVTGEYVELTAFEHYWHKDMPKVKRIIFKVIKSMEAVALALQKGEVDFNTYYVPPATLEMLKKNPDLVINLVRGFTYYYIGFNLRRPGLNRTLVRRALCYCMPKEEVVKGPLMGLGEPANWYISPRFKFYHNPDIPRKYPWVKGGPDLVEAARLLDSAYTRDVDGDGIREVLPIPKATPTPTPSPTPSPTPTPTAVAANMTQVINALNSLKSTVESLSGKLESTAKSITNTVNSLSGTIGGLSGYLIAIIVLVIINIIISIIAIVRKR